MLARGFCHRHRSLPRWRLYDLRECWWRSSGCCRNFTWPWIGHYGGLGSWRWAHHHPVWGKGRSSLSKSCQIPEGEGGSVCLHLQVSTAEPDYHMVQDCFCLKFCSALMGLIRQMSRQESRSSAGPDHVTLQALITWLIKSRSRD